MAVINVLPKSIFELIAAGEVVERPASAVKEVLENSIDAGATVITVEIKRGGITYIRVTDNGCGIAREDVHNAFVSHATSKIAEKDDLDAVMTLGFRGEALASIAAVSKVELLTRTADEFAGTRCCIEGGEQKLIDDAGCPVGTTLVIRDVFYNVPARMKFLKKDATEAGNVAAVVDRLALSHPEISFRFIKDDKQQLYSPGDGKLSSAVSAVFGHEFASGLMKVEGSAGCVSVSGLSSKPVAARPNRSMQIFFVNGRYVRTRTAAAALDEAYKNTITVGKYPACVLNITMPAAAVDVNIHPAKTEVRFADERSVFSAVYHAVRSALQGDVSRPQVAFNSKLAQKIYAPEIAKTEQIGFAAHPESPHSEPSANAFGAHFDAKPPVAFPAAVPGRNVSFSQSAEGYELSKEPSVLEHCCFSPQKEDEQPQDAPQAVQAATDVCAPSGHRVVGEAFKTYILVESDGKLLIIDKHAAHERMIFEQLKRNVGSIPSQLFLVPVTVTLGKKEYNAVLDNLDLLRQAGYELSDFGSGTVSLSECPAVLDASQAQDAVAELAERLCQNKNELTCERIEALLEVSSCRAAIKAGDTTREAELEIFTAELLSHPEIRFCPHGRPVIVELERREIEKYFGRV